MRILIADDDLIASRMLEKTLARLGHEIEVVNDGPDAITALLRPDAPSLAILDWEMPGADGLVVCRVVRQRPGPYTYIILLTGRDRPEDVVAGLESGADDFLSKPFDVAELRARVRSGERVLNLQERLLNAQESLRLQATSDELTSLANRRVVLEQLDRELRRARHEQKPLAVAMADIDNFKVINDRYGHPAGDAVLKQVARCMQIELREYDSIGRYGGEEFVFVLPGCEGDAARAAMDRVRTRVALTPTQWEGGLIPATVSIGIAWNKPNDMVASALVHAADGALYHAKALGRNRVEVRDPGFDPATPARRASERELATLLAPVASSG